MNASTIESLSLIFECPGICWFWRFILSMMKHIRIPHWIQWSYKRHVFSLNLQNLFSKSQYGWNITVGVHITSPVHTWLVGADRKRSVKVPLSGCSNGEDLDLLWMYMLAEVMMTHIYVLSTRSKLWQACQYSRAPKLSSKTLQYTYGAVHMTWKFSSLNTGRPCK